MTRQEPPPSWWVALSRQDSATPPAAKDTAERPAWRRGHGRLALCLLGLLIVLCSLVLGWRVAGGRTLTMQTPSMCPQICVGALLADRPLTGPLHTGEVITFYPPGDTHETYSHEIWHIFASGLIQTKGVANSQHDPWFVTRQMIVGRVVFTIPGAGWLLKVLPFLGIGVLIWVISRPIVSRRLCRAWDRAWLAAMLIMPVLVLHPLINAALVGSGGHPLQAKVANSGLLPEAFHHGSHVLAPNVPPGHVAHVTVRGASTLPRLRESAALQWWGWVIVVLVCAAPLLAYAWHIWRGDETLGPGGRRQHRQSPGAVASTTPR